jgi:uncharacterized protein
MATALITGGTSGIGAEFARAYARRGYDLVLVARDSERLAGMAGELGGPDGVAVEVMSADLSRREDVGALAARIEDASRPIDILVNNAGFGIHAPIATRHLDVIDEAFEVMVRAVFVLSGAAARAMKQRGSGSIINIASTAGYMTLGAYSSIKTWVMAHSESLSNELRGTGVTVTALAPGWVRTEFHTRAGIRGSSIPSFMWSDIDVVVETGIRDAAKGRVVSIPSARYKFLITLVRHLPRRTVRWVSRKISSSRNEEEPLAAPAAPRAGTAQ